MMASSSKFPPTRNESLTRCRPAKSRDVSRAATDVHNHVAADWRWAGCTNRSGHRLLNGKGIAGPGGAGGI